MVICKLDIRLNIFISSSKLSNLITILSDLSIQLPLVSFNCENKDFLNAGAWKGILLSKYISTNCWKDSLVYDSVGNWCELLHQAQSELK